MRGKRKSEFVGPAGAMKLEVAWNEAARKYGLGSYEARMAGAAVRAWYRKEGV